MRFSLKLLMALVLVGGVVAGLIGRRIRLSKPTVVPIRYEVVKGSNVRNEYAYPQELIMWRKPWLYRNLRELAIEENSPTTDDELLQQIIADLKT